jgi:hypothetical protein
MKADPPIRKSGRCALPGCKKKIKTITIYGEADAFCSTACCREWHGTSLPKPVRGIAVGASS